MNKLETIGVAMAGSKPGGWIYDKICRRIDKILIPLTRGRLSLGPSDTLLLISVGAKTGKTRKVPMAFIHHGSELVVVASKGGHAQHPAWYHNLKANPEVSVYIRGELINCTAREANDAERDLLWPQAVEFYQGFAAYQKHAKTRKIPMMILTPVN